MAHKFTRQLKNRSDCNLPHLGNPSMLLSFLHCARLVVSSFKFLVTHININFILMFEKCPTLSVLNPNLTIIFPFGKKIKNNNLSILTENYKLSFSCEKDTGHKMKL